MHRLIAIVGRPTILSCGIHEILLQKRGSKDYVFHSTPLASRPMILQGGSRNSVFKIGIERGGYLDARRLKHDTKHDPTDLVACWLGHKFMYCCREFGIEPPRRSAAQHFPNQKDSLTADGIFWMEPYATAARRMDRWYAGATARAIVTRDHRLARLLGQRFTRRTDCAAALWHTAPTPRYAELVIHLTQRWMRRRDGHWHPRTAVIREFRDIADSALRRALP